MTNPLHFVSPTRLVAGLIPAALALALVGCGGGSSDSTTYTLGGTVSALTASGLILQNGTQTLSVAANATSFAFTTAVSGSYDVTILTQPAGQTCSVTNASGSSSSGSAVTSVAVACRPYGVYVANKGSNTIATFSVGSTGALTATPAVTLATPFMPDSIVVSSDGLHAWVAYLDDNLISSLAIDSSANLSLLSASSQAVSAGDVLALGADGTSLYAAEYGASEVSQFSIPSSGQLPTAPATSVAAGVNPSAVAATADGAHLYVANASANTISGYSLSSSGVPTAQTAASVSISSSYGTGPKGLAVNPNGGYLYVTLSDSAKVVQYNVDASTGALTYHAAVATGTTPRGVTVAPSGSYAYVANYGSNTISQYTLAGGTLTPLSTPTVAAGSHPVAIAISPDGAYAYVTNYGDATISQYSISNGLLTPLATATVSSNGSAPISLAVR